MSINKVVVFVVFMVTIVTLSAMELEKKSESAIKEELKKSQELINSQSSNNVAPYTFSFSLPTITSAVSSLTATYNNYMYNTEAFRKLGWPITDKMAQQELETTLAVYKRINNYFQTRKSYEGLTEDHKIVERRYGYCRRVLEELPAIPKRSEALALATFCLNTHGQVMNDFLKENFLLFVAEETGKSIQEVQKAALEVAQLKIVDDNNPLLNNLFEQTAKEKQKKEEEERKRKEQEDKEKKDKKERERLEKEAAAEKQRLEKERIEREEKEKKDKEEKEKLEKEEAEKKRKEQENKKEQKKSNKK